MIVILYLYIYICIYIYINIYTYDKHDYIIYIYNVYIYIHIYRGFVYICKIFLLRSTRPLGQEVGNAGANVQVVRTDAL